MKYLEGQFCHLSLNPSPVGRDMLASQHRLSLPEQPDKSNKYKHMILSAGIYGGNKTIPITQNHQFWSLTILNVGSIKELELLVSMKMLRVSSMIINGTHIVCGGIVH